MKIAIEGCCHGELDTIYASIHRMEQAGSFKVDLLIICGDFQAVRNDADLESIAMPPKYRQIGSFWKYYSGVKRVPVPTIFIGGNHETSNYLWELYHGGWVAPNMYFLGFASCVSIGGIRIAGVSGIWKETDYDLGHHEQQPYDDRDTRSVYHVRKFNVYRLMQLTGAIDIFISHDWPRGIAERGNVRKLLSMKPFFEQEVRSNSLGSLPNMLLLQRLRPSYWFSAHLHVKYTAVWTFDDVKDKVTMGMYDNDQEVAERAADRDRANREARARFAASVNVCASTPVVNVEKPVSEEKEETENGVKEKSASQAPPEALSDATSPTNNPVESLSKEISPESVSGPKTQAEFTRFLSLDKCLPNHDFLQIIDVPTTESAHLEDGSLDIRHDKEWLAIVRACDKFMSTERIQPKLTPEAQIQMEIQKEIEWVDERIEEDSGFLKVTHNFEMTAQPHVENQKLSGGERLDALQPHINPQTIHFCDKLGIKNIINPNGMDNRGKYPFPNLQVNSEEAGAKSIGIVAGGTESNMTAE